jgi:hypothetical protein
MSKNSKNAKRIQQAKEISKLHAGGGKGPAKTGAKHGKKNAWWQVGFGSYRDFVQGKGKKKQQAKDEE